MSGDFKATPFARLFLLHFLKGLSKEIDHLSLVVFFALQNFSKKSPIYSQMNCLIENEYIRELSLQKIKPPTQRNFYTQTRLHRSFTYRRIRDLRPSFRAQGRRCPATKKLHFTTQLVCASDTHDLQTEKNFKIAILSQDLRRGSRFDGHVKRIWKNLEVGVLWVFSNTSSSPRIKLLCPLL